MHLVVVAIGIKDLLLQLLALLSFSAGDVLMEVSDGDVLMEVSDGDVLMEVSDGDVLMEVSDGDVLRAMAMHVSLLPSSHLQQFASR